MVSLDEHGLQTVYDTILRAEQVRREGVKELKDLFTEDPRLIISPNQNCNGGCLHCVSDSRPDDDLDLSYDGFSRIDPEFLKTFSAVDFGRKGNPLLYQSQGYNLADLMSFLNENGIDKFTLALGLQNSRIPVIGELEKLASDKNLDVETMVTYHHYHEDLDPTQLARDFNSTLKNFWGFSGKMLISLLGDCYVPDSNTPTKEREVNETFRRNMKTIFKDLDFVLKGPGEYEGKYKGKKMSILVPLIDTRVYPLGRFIHYLTDKGILEEYKKQFEESMTDYACPDFIKWPGIIIEPDGDLNLCGSFEAVNCKNAVVSNIHGPFEEVKKNLMDYHHREKQWFIDNLSGIIEGTVSSCKLKNKLVQKPLNN